VGRAQGRRLAYSSRKTLWCLVQVEVQDNSVKKSYRLKGNRRHEGRSKTKENRITAETNRVNCQPIRQGPGDNTKRIGRKGGRVRKGEAEESTEDIGRGEDLRRAEEKASGE